jgi:formylglycine-generating enzyme
MKKIVATGAARGQESGRRGGAVRSGSMAQAGPSRARWWVAVGAVLGVATGLGLGPGCGGAAGPGGDGGGERGVRPVPPVDAQLMAVPGGRFTMGDELGVHRGRADEAPRQVEVEGFRLMRLEVTNDQWAAFAAATGHRSAPERLGWGWVWDGRWRKQRGADWRHPFGPDSSITGRGDHPVVQVSARDAAAFCAHHGLRLPGDEEWERAARGDDGRRYPWGDAPPGAGGPPRASFGALACCRADDGDGFLTTAPVGSFPAGAGPYGHLDLAGNVWEWTASEFPGRPGTVALRGGGWGNDAFGIRAAFRHANQPDVGRDHVGLRCAADG